MQFEPPLIRARLIRRYKRFLADVILEDGREVTAHVANPGAMTGVKDEGLVIWLQPSNNPKRKLKYSWILADQEDQGLSGVDTSLTNKIVGEALRAGAIPELSAYSDIIPEQKYGENSRIDFLLRHWDLEDAYVEVKNVHLSRQPGLAEFPDSVTTRGAKHLRELADVARSGKRAVMLYVIQRVDSQRFRLAGDIDPAYSEAFKVATQAGVEVLVYDCAITTSEITLGRPIPFEPSANYPTTDQARL